MFRLITFALLLGTASCQIVPDDILQDLVSIFYNGVVALQDCGNTVVLLSGITFTLYTRSNQPNGVLLTPETYNQVNPQNRVIFINHGWLQSGSSPWVTEMKNVYLSAEDVNVIVLDWSAYAVINYRSAYCTVPLVGAFEGQLIYNLTTTGQTNLNLIQINGFSLGAHVAGFAGQEVKNLAGGQKIAKIHGLDAAGPGYLNIDIDKRLDSTDAGFVQGIHTSNCQFGYCWGYAHVDFEVNFDITRCGAVQYGCPLYPGTPAANSTLAQLLPIFFCSHIRAAVYMTESINSLNFLGVPCSSCLTFGLGGCKGASTTIMGEHCPTDASGERFLNTNMQSPFAAGNAGIPGSLLR